MFLTADKMPDVSPPLTFDRVYYARRIRWVSPTKMFDLACHDIRWNRGNRTRDIVEQLLLLARVEQTEKLTRLAIVIIIETVIVAHNVAGCLNGFHRTRILRKCTKATRLIVRRRTLITIHTHSPVTMEAIRTRSAARCVHRDLVMIDPQPIALRIAIRKQAALQ